MPVCSRFGVLGMQCAWAITKAKQPRRGSARDQQTHPRILCIDFRLMLRSMGHNSASKTGLRQACSHGTTLNNIYPHMF